MFCIVSIVSVEIVNHHFLEYALLWYNYQSIHVFALDFGENIIENVRSLIYKFTRIMETTRIPRGVQRTYYTNLEKWPKFIENMWS